MTGLDDSDRAYPNIAAGMFVMHEIHSERTRASKRKIVRQREDNVFANLKQPRCVTAKRKERRKAKGTTRRRDT